MITHKTWEIPTVCAAQIFLVKRAKTRTQNEAQGDARRAIKTLQPAGNNLLPLPNLRLRPKGTLAR
jgi:hypothetical protein